MVSILKKTIYLGLMIALMVMQSCNKEFEDIPGETVVSSGPSIGSQIETDANYSILKAALTRAGLLNTLKANGNRLTVFAPDDAAFALSGISLAMVNAMPLAQLQALLNYHVIPQALPSSQIPTTFPNVQMPTLLPLVATNPLVKMSIFPSRRGETIFANNIPVKQANIAAGNGVIHKVAALVAPPSQLVAQILGADTLSYFRAAIARADSGQSGLNRLDSVMKFGLANVTVFAPNNNAFIELFTAMGLPASEATFNFLPVQTVRGIVAYHILGVRAYSVNLPAATSTIQTLVGASPMPQLTVDRSEALPRLLGAGNRGMFSNFLLMDRNAVNGVVHVIDRVLLPQ